MSFPEDPLTNANIAELLATAAEDMVSPLNRAYRRASRKALLWTEEVSVLYRDGRTLTELPGIGPYLEKVVRKWIETSPVVPAPKEIRKHFFTRTQARAILAKKPPWAEVTSAIPVLVLTGLSLKNAKQMEKDGACGFFVKSESMLGKESESLLGVIARILRSTNSSP